MCAMWLKIATHFCSSIKRTNQSFHKIIIHFFKAFTLMKRPTQSYIYLVLFSWLLLNGNCNTQNSKQDKFQNTINKMASNKTDLPGMETTQSRGMSAYTNCPSKITVRKGDVFQVKLNANAGTGYVWALAKPSKLVAIKNETELRYEKINEDENVQKGDKQVGGKTLQVLELTALEVGTEKIELQYKRSWETTQSPADVCVIEVIVSGH